MIMSSGKSKIPKSTIYEDSSDELRRGPWTLEEDNLLIHYITSHGEGRWNSLAKFSGLKRTGKSCRLRWLNYLKPDIKRGNLTPHEQIVILELHSKWGNRWSKIAQNLPGRTDNEIKNYWRTRVQKQARQLKVDSNSEKFLEAIRMFWMPRLLEKIEQNSSLTSSPSSSTMEITQNFTAPSPVFINQDPLPSPSNTVNNKTLDSTTSLVKIPDEIPGFLTPGKKICGKSLEDECYHVGFPGCDKQELEYQHMSLSNCHVEEVDWFGDDLGSSSFWDSDELWQFRKPDEVGF